MKVEKESFQSSNLFYRLSKNPTELIYITKLIKNTSLIDIRLKPLLNKNDEINNSYISIYNFSNKNLLIEKRSFLLCQGIQLVEDFQSMFGVSSEWKYLLEEYRELIIKIGVKDIKAEEFKSRSEIFKFRCQDILLINDTYVE